MTKQIFTQSQQPEEEEILPKQEFYNVETTIDNEPLEGELLDEQFEQIVKPKSSGWKTALKLTALLFLGATVAQSVQWIWDSYQNQQWIYLAFALVSFVVVLFGLSEIIAEWRRLVKLKKRLNLQEQSQRLIGESAVKNHQVFSEQDSEKGKALCLSIADTLKLDSQHPSIVQWEKQLNESYSAREVTHLFSKTVLQFY